MNKKSVKVIFVFSLAGVFLMTACAEFKETGRTIGHTTRDVTREIGHGTRSIARNIGHGTRQVFKAVGNGTKVAVRSVLGYEQ